MKVLIVDDHRLVRAGFRALLEQAGVEVVGEAGSGHEAIVLAQTLRPQIVLMDISMPDLNGVDATRQLVAEHPKIRVIGLSMNADRAYVMAMFKAGAVGYLPKDSAADELLRAVSTVAAGQTYISPSIAAGVITSGLDGTAALEVKNERALSPRERQVLQLIAEGNSSKDIAGCLNISVPTVDTHRHKLMDKLNIHSIAELTKYAVRERLTSLD